jgi:hypothetical protein
MTARNQKQRLDRFFAFSGTKCIFATWARLNICSATCRGQSVRRCLTRPSYLETSPIGRVLPSLATSVPSASAPRSGDALSISWPLFLVHTIALRPFYSIGAVIRSIYNLPSNPPTLAKSRDPIVPAAFLCSRKQPDLSRLD